MLKLVTGATPDSSHILSLNDFKDFVVDMPDSENTEALLAVQSAVEDLEQHTGRSYGVRTYDLVLDKFPGDDYICLPMPPLISVASVKYIDSSDVEQTLVLDTDYSVYGVGQEGFNTMGVYGGYIQYVSGVGWPADANVDKPEIVTIRFLAGYSTPGTIPALARMAARIRANKYYSFKGATYDEEADKLYWETIQPLIVHSFA